MSRSSALPRGAAAALLLALPAVLAPAFAAAADAAPPGGGAAGAEGTPAESAFRCSARGGAPWREYRSRHFVVATDAPRASAELLVNDLEVLHALVVAAIVGDDVEIPGRVRVLAPSSPALFRSLAGSADLQAYVRLPRDGGSPIIVLPIVGRDADPEAVAHEIAHRVSWYLFPRQPTWFAEGLAMFAQTVATAVDEDAPTGSHIVVGARSRRRAAGVVPRHFAGALASVTPMPPAELLSWNDVDEREPGRRHVWSWLLYHWLWNRRPKEFAEYTRRLSDATDHPAAAWRAAFPDLNPEEPSAMVRLANELDRYRTGGRYAYFKVDAKADAAFAQAALPPAAVHGLVAEAAAWSGEEGSRRRDAEYAEALREDPGNPAALVWLARREPALPLAALRASAGARPSDPTASTSLGVALLQSGDLPGAEVALRRAIALDPDHAASHAILARTLREAGRPREALPFANRALDLQPWSPGFIEDLARIAADLGKCKEAVVLGRRAVVLIGDPEASAPLRERVEAWERGCAAPAQR
jgi:tetratricopeptide (TPR) repeat protein